MLKIFLLILLSFPIFAAENRWLDLEWDEIQDAKEYEVELFQEEDGESLTRGKFKTEEPKWSHNVSPGKYSLRIRSIDKRGVPGEWSDKIPLKVKNFNPVLLKPGVQLKVAEPLVSFEWLPVVGITNYQLVIRDSTNAIIQNTTSPRTAESVYLKPLGNYSWSVFALTEEEGPFAPESLPEKSFQSFQRVEGELGVPVIKVTTKDGLLLSWPNVVSAKTYEIHYMPPIGSGQKNRRIETKKNSFRIPKASLQDGVTTITLNSLAPGHQDSPKTILKIKKGGDDVSVDEIVKGESKGLEKPLNQLFWNHQIYAFIGGARYGYKSENTVTDTKLDQDDLTSLALTADWIYQKTPEKNIHKFDTSFLSLKAGSMKGKQSRLGYDYLIPFKTNVKVWAFGGGLSYLSQPVFLGNRFNSHVTNEPVSSLGPELIVMMTDPLSLNWHLNANFIYSYQAFFLGKDEVKAYSWTRIQLRLMRYFNMNQALFVGAEHQRWSQDIGASSSTLSGWSLGLGYKLGW